MSPPRLPDATALLSVREGLEVDRLTVASGMPGAELMANAGAAVTRAIVQRWDRRPVVVLCGPGSNGGDGFVTARLLADAGWPVRVALLGSRDKLTGEARQPADRWKGPVEALTPKALEGAALVVDALFGAGLDRALEGSPKETLVAAAQMHAPIVSIDVPSGLMGDTGEAMGAVAATMTVTYLRKKPCHVLLPGRELCGEVVVADIGYPPAILQQISPQTFENDPGLWAGHLPHPRLDDNKHSRGHALVYGGYPITGSARLAARASARAGAGLTTVACPEAALPIYAATLTSVMVAPLPKREDFDHMLDGDRFSAVLIGPGAGTDRVTHDRVVAVLASKHPAVIDADAITVFQSDPAELDRAIQGSCVLTPHDGEFRRVFDPSGDKLTRTRAAAKRCGGVVLLKGDRQLQCTRDVGYRGLGRRAQRDRPRPPRPGHGSIPRSCGCRVDAWCRGHSLRTGSPGRGSA